MSRPAGLGLSADNPITVGGGLLFGPFNARHYLGRLRDAAGEELGFTRIGSSGDGNTVVDIYTVRSAIQGSVCVWLDVYRPGPNGVPDGLSLDRPDEPWLLARSLVPLEAESSVPPADADEPNTWTLTDQDGESWGTVEYIGIGRPLVDTTPTVGRMVDDKLNQFLSLTPPGYSGSVIADYLEVYLPFDSGGMLRGVRRGQ